MTLTTTTDKPTYLNTAALLRAMPPHLQHYAGAAHRDPVAREFCRAWCNDPTADEPTLKSRALKEAWGVDVTPAQIRAANPGMR